MSYQQVNGAHTAAFAHDDDGLLTQAGALALGRDAQTGLLASTSLGTVATSLGHNGFGEVTSETATVGGSSIYATTFTRDLLGRITQKIETIQGTTTTTDYLYDPAGRLEHVKVNGTLVRTYAYDSNGNRLSVVDAATGTTAGSYDAQDRIATYGSVTYTHDAAGDLVSRTDTATSATTLHTYDALGNLTQATLPDGRNVTYAIDPQSRRVGKRIDGTLVQGFLYQDPLNPVAELDGNGNVVARFVYGEKPNVPAYVVKGGSTYRILSDHLGSVRLVVDSSTGTVAQRLDYDEFGNITADSSPGFQPFAFAGGLYDADTKLTRFGARDYDPIAGRWTTKDPIRFDGGLNLYGYTFNDPVNFIDSNGLWVAQAVGGTLGAGVAAYNAHQNGASGAQVAKAAFVGGVAGVASTFGIPGLNPALSGFLVGGGTGFAGDLAFQYATGTPAGCLDYGQAAISGLAGGAGGSLGNAVGGLFWPDSHGAAVSAFVGSFTATAIGAAAN